MVVIRRDPERLKKLRIAIRYLLREDVLERGHQTRLAEHFDVSRQRVHQVVNEEQRRREQAAQMRLRASSLRAAQWTGAVPAPRSGPAMSDPRPQG